MEECWPCPVFASFTLAFALQLRKKHGKNLSQGKKNLSQVKENLSQSTVYILPKIPTHYKTPHKHTYYKTHSYTHTHARTHTTKQYKTIICRQDIQICTLFIWQFVNNRVIWMRTIFLSLIPHHIFTRFRGTILEFWQHSLIDSCV